MLKQKKLPTILGIIILIIGLAAGVFLVTQGQEIFLRASPEVAPNQIKVTNITDNSFTLSWITQKETSGFIKYGVSPSLEKTLADDRDQISGETGSFTTHYVTLVNLKPNTTYYYKIGSGGKIFPTKGQPYESKSAPVAQGLLPPSDVASGIISKPDGTPAEGAIVYLSMANTASLSVMVKSSGSWLIPLNTALTADLNSFTEYDKEAQVVDIFVEAGSLGHSTAVATTKNDNPVPPITLGETYDFRQYTEPPATTPPVEITLTPSPTATPAGGFNPGELEPVPTATSTGELSIINPEQGEDLNALKPEFTGTGPPGKLVEIVVESPSYTGTIKVNEDGSWDWSPPADLEPGTHTIKITYGGQTVSKTFTVLAAGESNLPAYTATPSATISPSPTPTLKPTPTPLPRTEMPSTEAGIPGSGFVTPTFFFFIIGTGFMATGFLLKRFLFSD
jgi:hypothetical protein